MPRRKLPPLLVAAGERNPERLHWLGASFGVTGPLLRLWKRAGFKLVYLRQTTSDLTGAFFFFSLGFGLGVLGAFLCGLCYAGLVAACLYTPSTGRGFLSLYVAGAFPLLLFFLRSRCRMYA